MSFFGNPLTNIFDYGHPKGSPPPIVFPIFFSSTVGMKNGDKIQIMLDNKELFTTTIMLITGPGAVLIKDPLPYFASAGNIVIDVTQDVVVTPPSGDNIT